VDRARSSRLGRALLHRTHVQSHPRLFGAGATAIVIYFLLSGWTGTATRLLIAFDGGAVVFLAAVWVMMATADPACGGARSSKMKAGTRFLFSAWRQRSRFC
jgi:hypothetical protein